MSELSAELVTGAGQPGEDDGGRLIRGASLRVIGYATMIMLSVIGTAVVTRALGVARFGQYATIISVTALVATVTDSGMTNVSSHEYALRHGAQRDHILGALLGLRLTLTLVGAALSVGFALAAHYDTALLLGMVVASLATFPLILLHTLSIPLTNELRLGTLSMLELARQGVWVGSLVILAIAGAGVLPLLATLLLANLVLIPVTVHVARRYAPISLALRFSGWRDLLGATAVFSIGTAVGFLYLYGTQLITSLVTTHHQTGLFSLGFRIFVVVYNVPLIVGSAAVPLLARAGRDDHERLSYVLRRYLQLSAVAGVGVALALSAASGFIIPVIAGPKFHGAIGVASIQCFALVGTFISAPCVYGLLSLHLYKQLLWANLVALGVMIAATCVLAGAYGADGAAIASICAETSVAVLMLGGLLAARADSRPDGAFLAKLLLASACGAAVVFAPSLPALVRTVAVVGVYGAIVLVTRALPDELLQTLPLVRSRSV